MIVWRSLLFSVRFNVLVHAKEIIGIVFRFDLAEPLIIVAVSFFHALFAFVAHQKIYVRPASRVGMQRVVVTLRPRNDFVLVRRVRIDAHDHHRPVGVAIIPGSLGLADACCGKNETAWNYRDSNWAMVIV